MVEKKVSKKLDEIGFDVEQLGRLER